MNEARGIHKTTLLFTSSSDYGGIATAAKSSMSILVLGGRGKTASRLAELLHASKKPFIVASRSKSESSPYKQVNFDWENQETWAPIFKHSDPPITAVYLVVPRLTNLAPIVNTFIDQAKDAGVDRVVLLSAAPIEAGGVAHGQVHQYLIDSGLSYCVLRPTWFMENFSQQQHLPTIRDEGKIYSATKAGKIPWVSADDIAAVAYKALTDERSHDTDHLILGPELLSYADVSSRCTLMASMRFAEQTVRKNTFRGS